ncbi:DUF6875 domain-containing protein [Streptomyces sp. SID9727]|uniref:DUF6875 domain-containing protein n=1 Tax=Streptomyces sp. SID9727 TaxID=2706114 RepID=UPI0013CA7C14|nr:hypothetical protein [Streptomyces sp. SID9727]NEC69462.1 hypothetical protein [Streptomyces sp. SID9727]
MRGDSRLQIYTPGQVDRGLVPAGQLGPLREVLEWSRTFLVSSHPELGRSGPVCPYTQPSLRAGRFLLAVPAQSTPAALPGAVEALRTWYERLASELPEDERELLTVLMVLPELDHGDPAGLDLLQADAKDDFVAQGLMIGQFHPLCAEPGLWNEDFAPLRSPVPLLAVRRLLVFDLPFLVGADRHIDHYLRRFAPGIPARVRDQLVNRVVS